VAALAISNQREDLRAIRSRRNAAPSRHHLARLARRYEVAELSAEIGANRIHRISGKPPDVVPCLYRCRWFERHMPDLWTKMSVTAEVHGFLAFKLTGQW